MYGCCKYYIFVTDLLNHTEKLYEEELYLALLSCIARIGRKLKQSSASTVKSDVEAKVLYISNPIIPRALHCFS